LHHPPFFLFPLSSSSALRVCLFLFRLVVSGAPVLSGLFYLNHRRYGPVFPFFFFFGFFFFFLSLRSDSISRRSRQLFPPSPDNGLEVSFFLLGCFSLASAANLFCPSGFSFLFQASHWDSVSRLFFGRPFCPMEFRSKNFLLSGNPHFPVFGCFLENGFELCNCVVLLFSV